MKTIRVITLATGLLFGQARNGPQILWPGPVDEASSSTFALSASVSGSYSQSQLAHGFIATDARQLSKIHVNVSATTGTIASSDFCAGLYSDNGAKPGTAIEIRCTTDAVVSGAGVVAVNGFTATSTTTRGTAYHAVILNADATPASNNFTLLSLSANTPGGGFGSLVNATTGHFGGLTYNTSSDGGTTWTKAARVACIVLEWTDGTKEGFPCVSTSATNIQAYGSPAREGGLLVQTGAQPMRVVGVAGFMNKNSTPSGNARFKIYSGSGSSGRTLLGTTDGVPAANISLTRSYVVAYFSAPIVIPAYTWISIVLGNSATDSGTSNFRGTTIDLMSAHAGLWFRWSPSAPKTTATTDGASTWTDTSNQTASFALILDPSAPFPQIGGGFFQ